MQLSIIILAAGKGTRIKSDLPKCMAPLGGIPMIRRLAQTCKALGSDQILAVTGWGRSHVEEELRNTLGDRIQFVVQSEQKGTADAVRCALPQVDAKATVLVLYSDVPLTSAATLKKVAAEGRKNLAILTGEVANPHGYGRILRSPDRGIAAIVEEAEASSEQRRITEINSGILAAPAVWLTSALERVRADNASGEYYLTDVAALAQSDGVVVSAVEALASLELRGINSRLELSVLERDFQRAEAERLLNEGVCLADPNRFDLRGHLHCGRDVRIDINAIFEGQVEIGDNCFIGPHCTISDSSIAAGTIIKSNCVVEGARIGRNCIVGPFARLRPGTVLDEGVSVGNYVEIKESRLRSGVKSSHLTYIGDADIGRGTNIGAGVITCNYDGQQKHRTRIGKKAFIGSNSQLVAPVEIGDGAFVGAGSTITKNVMPQALALSRSRQQEIEKWAARRGPDKKNSGTS